MNVKNMQKLHSCNNIYNLKQILLIFIFIAFKTVLGNDELVTAEFSPQVTATCKGGLMNIKAYFTNPYFGAVHARGYRNSECIVFGNGSNATSISLNIYAKPTFPDYCGILVNNHTEEQQRSVQLAIRMHKTLELADDKFYIITCGRTSILRDSNVLLQLLENNHRVRETVYGREYMLKAQITKSNGTSNIKVTNCFAFNQKNSSTALIDERGCPSNPKLMTQFYSNAEEPNSASAIMKSMFKFPEGSAVHFQCDIILCNTNCLKDLNCDQIRLGGIGLKSPTDLLAESSEEKHLAATTVFVLDPADETLLLQSCDKMIRPVWLLWLAITLGILFFIMLLMNIFLCTAMSCSCARTEIIEKEPSIIEEYDPYRSWHGSQYGSRYSLHGRDGQNKGYTSGASTIHSNRSDRY